MHEQRLCRQTCAWFFNGILAPYRFNSHLRFGKCYGVTLIVSTSGVFVVSEQLYGDKQHSLSVSQLGGFDVPRTSTCAEENDKSYSPVQQSGTLHCSE